MPLPHVGERHDGHQDLPVILLLLNSVTISNSPRQAVGTGRRTYDLDHTPGRVQFRAVSGNVVPSQAPIQCLNNGHGHFNGLPMVSLSMTSSTHKLVSDCLPCICPLCGRGFTYQILLTSFTIYGPAISHQSLH